MLDEHGTHLERTGPSYMTILSQIGYPHSVYTLQIDDISGGAPGLLAITEDKRFSVNERDETTFDSHC